jgi:hypothetical protein
MNRHLLIPTNGTHVSETQFPKGFLVASYDAEGFVTAPRWFATIDAANRYAAQIGRTK